MLTNLRKTNLEKMQEFNLQFNELIALFEQELCEQKLKRVRKSLENLNENLC